MGLNKQLIRSRFASHFQRYDKHALVQRAMAARLAAMIKRARRGLPVRRGVELGIGTGFLSRHLLGAWPHAEWTLNDLAPEAAEWVGHFLQTGAARFLPGDAERLPFPPGQDLLASASAMQWFDDLPAFFSRAREALLPGGLLALGTFAPGNMREVREIAGTGLDYPAPEVLTRQLEDAEFEVLEMLRRKVSLIFPDAMALLCHLRETGVNALSPSIWTPRRLRSFCERYESVHHAPRGGVTLTYEPLLLTARRKSLP